MCLTYFGFEEDEAVLHAVSGFALLGVIAFKVAVGATSAGDFLANGPE
jgi:hypothetical protein